MVYVRNLQGEKYLANPQTVSPSLTEKKKQAFLLRKDGFNVRTIPVKGGYLNYVARRKSSGPLALQAQKRVEQRMKQKIRPSTRQWFNKNPQKAERLYRGAMRANLNDNGFILTEDNVIQIDSAMSGAILFSDNGTSSRKYNARRPQMLVVGEDQIPMSKANNYSEIYGNNLDVEQSRGVDLMVSSLLDRPESELGQTDGGFLLADGTGFGKTRQLLAVADQWRTNKGSKVIIITENRETIEGSFAKDAQALGIDTSDFVFTTYTELGTNKRKRDSILSQKYGLVIYDEAHNMKNIITPQSEIAQSVNADKAVFATATPLDSAPGAGYFLSKVTGIDQELIFNNLGIVKERGAGGIEYYTSNLPQRTIRQRLEAYREQLIRAGLMMRRTYPFYGDIISTSVQMTEAAEREQDDILEYYANKLPKSRTKKGQLSLELARWEEYHKIPMIYENIKESIEDGKQVVVAMKTSGPQTFRGMFGQGPGSEKTKQTLRAVKKRIKELDKRSLSLTGKKSGFIPVKKYPNKEIYYVGRPGATQVLIERLEQDGIPYSQLTQSQKGIGEVNDFQSGRTKVMVMTPQSGGTGINLDDTTGENPRHLIIGSKGWAGDKMEQLLGRVSRKTTKSSSLAEVVGLDGGRADQRQTEVLRNKLAALRSITGTSDEWELTKAERVANNRFRENLVAPLAVVA